MEDWMESSLEEKVDIENLELLTFDPNTNKDLTFKHQIKCKKEEEPLNSSDVNLLAENHENKNIVKEPENDREYTKSGISSNENEKCQICGLVFGNKAVLNTHTSVVHPKEAKNVRNEIVKEKALYKCSVCTYKAKNRSSLKVHIGKVHERKRNHECSICNAGYSARSSLKKHQPAERACAASSGEARAASSGEVCAASSRKACAASSRERVCGTAAARASERAAAAHVLDGEGAHAEDDDALALPRDAGQRVRGAVI